MAKILVGKYEGSIYPEGNGYTGAIDLGTGPDGKRQRLKRKGKNKTAVMDKLKEAVEELEKGIKSQRNYTVRKAVDDYISHLEKQGRAPQTIKTYKSLSKNVDRIGAVKLREFTPDQVATWMDDLSTELATGSLGILHSLITRSIRYAERRDLVGRNVAAVVDRPQGREGRKSKSLTLEQTQTVLKVASDPKHRIGAYVILAIASGLRTEELRALTWSNVDLDDGIVYVIRSERHGGDTKTKTSRRGLGIPPIAVQALSALRRLPRSRMRRSGVWGRSPLSGRFVSVPG